MIQTDRPELRNIQDLIALLSSDLSKYFTDIFMSQGGNTGNGFQHGEHVYYDPQAIDAFTRAGYTLESNDEDENGWAPLNRVKQSSLPSVDLN
jgi:hypothetical protein